MRSRSFRAPVAIATAAVALFAFAGCASTGSETAGADAEVLGTVDTMYGEVSVPKPEGDLKVVALGWSDAEMALALGVTPIAVYDWQAFGEENKGVGPWATELFGETTPELIERGDEALNFEQIEALDPDVILNVRAAADEKEFDRLSEIAPTVYAPEGTGDFATEWDVQLESVASALGLGAEAETLIADTETAIADAAEANPEFAGLTTASAAKFGDAYGAYLPGDGRFDILAGLGFTNAPTVDSLEAFGFYAAVPVEQVAAFESDVLVVLPIGFTLDETKADPLLTSLKVVSEGRTVFIDPDSDLAGAWGASSVLSIPVVLDEIVPQLAAAAAK